DGESLLGFVSRGGEGAKLAALRQGSFLNPPRNKNPRRHQGLNVKRKRPTRRAVGLAVGASAQIVWLLVFDFAALCGALNFCARAEKGRRLV
ncbi:hypothetical protein KXR69_26105, partial [Ralstonia holmesii]|uniref:hypothetical protein n=1 Tax=Ralstonia holmesii TaxID=3058602 RepID=UPI003F1835B5